MINKNLETLLHYLEKMTIFEIYGFGKLVGAEEAPKFEDYVTNILVCYNGMSRKMRKEILALAKQVVLDKKKEEENKKDTEVGKSQS